MDYVFKTNELDPKVYVAETCQLEDTSYMCKSISRVDHSADSFFLIMGFLLFLIVGFCLGKILNFNF